MITRKYRVVIELFLAAFAAVSLNVICLASLHANEPATFGDVVFGIEQAGIVYGLLFIVLLILTFLKRFSLIKYIIYLFVALMSVNLIQNLIILIMNPSIQKQPIAILVDAGLIWVSGLLIFALWYWMIDSGGPIARSKEYIEKKFDFLFAQYQANLPGRPDWKPEYIDYVFLSFFTSSSFAPADVLPLSRKVKFIMMCQATLSLVIIGMVVSRAVSLLN